MNFPPTVSFERQLKGWPQYDNEKGKLENVGDL